MTTEEPQRSDDVSVILSGTFSDEKLFESEILTHGGDYQYFLRLGRTFDYHTTKRLAEIAIKYSNVAALQALSHLQPIATSAALSTTEGLQFLSRAARDGNISAPQFFFRLRHHLRGRYRETFREIARSTIIHVALRISGRGLRPETFNRIPFYPGLDEFDLESTFEQTLDKPNSITYTDIIGIERVARKKNGIIILDTSGSMVGPKILTAALAAAVAAYHLRHDKYALIAFNTIASTIKGIEESLTIDHIVDTILDTEPAGYTNITDGLRLAYRQFQQIPRPESWVILITDGIANRGGSPDSQARQFHNLHVLQTPGPTPQGDETCQTIAKLGKGRYIKVDEYTSVPRALMQLLSQT